MKLFERIFVVFSLFIFTSFANLHAQDTTIVFQLTIPIQSGIDDVEELASGEIYEESTDLELAMDTDNGWNQIVGLHFKNLAIDPGVTIAQAYIQFTTDEVSNGNCSLLIKGEAADNASGFGTNFYNVSNRTRTNEDVFWSPGNWTIPQAQTDLQRTPDIASVLQEIIDRPGWQKGNSINLFINGSGRRTAFAFEGNVANAVAKLVVDVEIPVSQNNFSNIYINEVMAKNSIHQDEFGQTEDWVELYNDNETAVLLNGLFVSDKTDNKTKWQIDGAVVIPPKGFTVLWLDDDPEQGADHAPFQLNSDGETLLISQAIGDSIVVLDSIAFENMPKNVSYGRQTDGAAEWVYFGEISPEASNNGSGLYLDAALSFSKESGFYENGFQLTMTCTDPDAAIRYTTDGSPPTITSTLYTQAPFINQTSTIKAAVFKPGFANAAKKDAFFLINTTHELPVIQLSIDPKYLWDSQEGMYITGTNGITGNCSDDVTRNWNQDWERPISIRYFEPDGTEAFQLDAGMKIAGGCSRAFSKKPFNIFFKKNTYGDDKIEYPLFRQLDFDEFSRLKLRSSGNDISLTMIRDASIQAMLYNEVDLDQMAYEPVVVYLNREYWGFYGLRELFNKDYIMSHHGVPEDSLDLLKNPYGNPEVKTGDAIAWGQLTQYLNNNTLVLDSDYEQAAAKIDINEFINYNIAEIYIANYDWPANNVAVWRNYTNGKWRWMLYDTDISAGYEQWSPSTYYYNMIDHSTTTTGPNWPNGAASTLFLRKLLTNKNFEEEFTQRTCTFAQVLFAPERAERIIDSLASQIESELPLTISKFNNAPWEWKQWSNVPVGGSLNSWEGHLTVLKTFFDLRLSYVLSHYENKFNYSGHFTLTVNYDANTNGTVVFHSNEMKIPYQYTASYFRNVPIQIKAIPKPGYRFVRWVETGETNPVIQYQSSVTSTLTPIFEEDITATSEITATSKLEIFPIPTQNELIVKLKESVVANLPIRIYTTLGEVVYQEKIALTSLSAEHIIDVRNWASGVYFLETMIDGQMFLKKIVVE